ncbi:MAG: LytTR family DNA-binding domain-containing protein [Melioribacteraceae bacterium]|nr:LytTR family DNA-binding domain-containing protein [Melioribacteraceae bacterium]
MIKCMILEDDLMARKSLERLCSKMDNLELVASCEDVGSALKTLENDEIDLIFLDIEVGDSTGFELLDKSPVLPEVIVTSAKEEYAFEAFQYEVSNYLKKPISFPKFKAAVERISGELQKKTSQSRKNHIFIRSEGRYINLKLDEIFYIENIGDYARFHTENKSHIVHGTMKGLAEKLPSDQFMKVHRSFIVNLEKIKDIEENSLLVGRQIIPVSRSNKTKLIERLNLL